MSTAPLTVSHETGNSEVDHSTETCTACQHPRESHDATSSRFCAATTALGADRRCICRVETLDGAQQAGSSHRFGHASTVPRGV